MVAPGVAEHRSHRSIAAAVRSPVRPAAFVAGAFLLTIVAACAQQPTQTAVQPAPTAPVVETPPAEPAPLPGALIGADRDTLAMRLGKPVFLMRAQTSEIWQYRAPGCVLDLYLYEETDVLRVAYLEARDLDGNALAPADCVRAVHAGKEPWPTATGT